MKRSRYQFCLCSGISLLMAFTVVASSLSQTLAQKPTVAFQDVPVQLSQAQASVFKDALSALAQQGHVCIVAEGMPLHPTLTPASAPTVPDHAPLSWAVPEIAGAYDYDCTRTGSVFVLKKRYTDPADLPFVTIAECTDALQRVHALLASYAPPDNDDPRQDIMWENAKGILGILSPDQMRQALTSQGLPISGLGGAQMTAVQNWTDWIYLNSPTDVSEQYYSSFLKLHNAQLGVMADPADRSGKTQAFGWQESDVPSSKNFIPFTDTSGFKEPPDSAGTWATPAERETLRAHLVDEKTDGPTTLRDEVAVLDAGGSHFQVRPSLAAKPVIVAGGSNVSSLSVLQALAAAYGLRAYGQLDGTTLLTYPQELPVQDLGDLRSVVMDDLPAPLLRSAHISLEPASKPDGMNQAGLGALFHLKAHRLGANARREATLRLEAASELYPQTARKNGMLPVSSLTDEDQSAFAVALTMDYLIQMRGFLASPPGDGVTGLNQQNLVLTVQVYPQEDTRGKWKVMLMLQRSQATGTLEPVTGMYDVAYNGPPVGPMLNSNQ